AESYIHRIGRTGRAGSNGQAVSLAVTDQGALVRDIERLLKKSIRVVSSPGAEILRFDDVATGAKPGARGARPAARGASATRGAKPVVRPAGGKPRGTPQWKPPTAAPRKKTRARY
ncbi:MAG: hypothetical protein LBT11_02450, partial [Treponema sp.]|nr:hypothetical protein [Treponema sp.]